eukprot:3350259-Amphidinium_carterae.1
MNVCQQTGFSLMPQVQYMHAHEHSMERVVELLIRTSSDELSIVLKRLVDVGGCDPTDWRLTFIASRHACMLELIACPYSSFAATFLSDQFVVRRLRPCIISLPCSIQLSSWCRQHVCVGHHLANC